MKRILILVMVAVLSMCMVAGCVGEVKSYTDSEQTINIGVNQEFVIALSSNPTTGYRWQVTHDSNMLDLIETKYEMGQEAKQGLVGAGGVELFRFKALKAGKTEITLVYKRPWQEPTPQDVTRVFTVNIK